MDKQIPEDEKFTVAELQEFTVEELKTLFTDYELEIPKGNKPELLEGAVKIFATDYNPESNGPDEEETPEEPESEPKGVELDVNQITNLDVKEAPEKDEAGIKAMEELRGAFLTPQEAQHHFNAQRVAATERLRNPKED